ncbi:hypothetical protein HYT02_03580 [Candidatus Gottesmanbacteria bacterium]|nr:hypothetical protein [Candidatus Gottesmanbacteria bacterium]
MGLQNATLIDNQSYITPSWTQTGLLCFNLAQNIISKKIHIDRLIALADGGLTWSKALLDYLDVSKLSTLQVKFYQDIGKTNNRPIIVQSLATAVQNETVLLFDDVVDSGETVKIAKEYLLMCGAKKVYTSSLFIKDWVQTKPDFYAANTSSWIIFPHEIREMIKLLYSKWKKERVSENEIKKRLVRIGISKKEVDYFIKII